MKRWLETEIDERLLLGTLLLTFAASLVLPMLAQFADWDIAALWGIPVVLAALFTITKIVRPLPMIQKDVRYLREIANVGVQRMPTVRDFYEGLILGLQEAASTIDLTHIRDEPPRDFGPSAGDFFSRLVKWCQAEDGRSIRRLIAVKSPAMHAWAQELAEETQDIPQFEIRVVAWSSEFPALNMAIIDEKAVYLALTGSTVQRTRGLAIEDSTTAQYFRDYYENIWQSAVDLHDWLATTTVEFD